MKKIAAVIPARYGSRRFPGKPLKKILGKAMIEMVYDRVRETGLFSDVVVGTDDKRVFDLINNSGGRAEMTSANCPSGTDRVWEVAKNLDADAVVNVQGDEPLISEVLLSDICSKLSNDDGDVVTAAFFNNSVEDFYSENVVKVILSGKGRAIYFSRSPVPNCKKEEFPGFYHHIGIYGYPMEKLEKFVNLPESPLEKQEKLEQLRLIDNGISVYVIKTEYRSQGVDIPEDIKKIEAILKGNLN